MQKSKFMDFGMTLKHAPQDISAGFVVFLVALPLCLGIALASDAPLASGLLSGLIAGLFVSWLSGSQLSVSGPSAGLSLTIASAIATLGSFESVLVAIFLAGTMQIAFGIGRLGFLASYFPHSVIKGMLASIGLIIILKQIPHAVGWDHDFIGDESFDQKIDHDNTFSGITHALERVSPGAIIVSFAVALILWIWSRKLVKAHSLSRFLPGPLIAVIIGLCVNELLKRVSPDLALTALEGHLVQIPRGGITSFLSHLPRPHWPAIAQLATWKVAGTIAAIASIETLLSVEAGDKIDPERRCTNTNRELIAQGTGNFLCGMFGGMPMTSAIVRTSANIYEGAKTKLACFMHGFFLLIAVFFLASALNHIPLAALAIVLISVGLKLVSIDFFKRTLAEGMEQFIPFIVTIVAVLLTDLLTGVGIGLVVGLAIVLRMNHHSALTMVQDGTDVLVRFAKDVTFVHKPELREILARIPEESTVVIDGTGAQFIDHDILEAVRDFEESALRRSIKVNLKNLRSRRMSFRGGYRGKL